VTRLCRFFEKENAEFPCEIKKKRFIWLFFWKKVDTLKSNEGGGM